MIEAATGNGAQRGSSQNIRINVLNDSLREASSSRIAVSALILFNFPQIIAAIVVLSLHWPENSVCDAEHRLKWRVWSLIATIRMTLHMVTIFLIIGVTRLVRQQVRQTRLLMILQKLRNLLDAAGLIWFLVGNMWLFGGSDMKAATVCVRPTQSPIYNLCLAMVVFNYIQICLPCIIAILMIPVLCFCLPCLIHVLRWMRDAEESKGASQADIKNLPLVKFKDLESADSPMSAQLSCPICLMDFASEDEIRILPCKHYFHDQCIGEWLGMNSTCPSCRKNILKDPANQDGEKETRDTEMVDLSHSSSGAAEDLV